MLTARRPRGTASRAGMMSDAEKRQIGDQFENGDTLGFVAATHNLQLREITAILDELGIQWRQNISAAQRTRDRFEKQVIDTYRDGGSAATVGAEFGLTAYQVLSILIRHGVPRRPRGARTAAKAQIETAVTAALERTPLREAAKQHGLNPSKLAALLISRWVEEDKSTRPGRGRRRSESSPPAVPPLVRRVAREYLAGDTITEIAARHQMSGASRVSRLLIRYAESRLGVP